MREIPDEERRGRLGSVDSVSGKWLLSRLFSWSEVVLVRGIVMAPLVILDPVLKWLILGIFNPVRSTQR
jgi:hypothetical protein